jgi:hypothetical protein
LEESEGEGREARLVDFFALGESESDKARDQFLLKLAGGDAEEFALRRLSAICDPDWIAEAKLFQSRQDAFHHAFDRTDCRLI